MLQTFQVIDTKRMKWKLKLVSDDVFQEKNFFRVIKSWCPPSFSIFLRNKAQPKGMKSKHSQAWRG